SSADNNWYGVTYGNGLFVAVASSGTGNRVMTSPDGIVWTIRSSAADNTWTSVTYANGLFVAVANSGTGNRAMTSGSFVLLPVNWLSIHGNLNRVKQAEINWRVAEQNVIRYQVEKSSGANSFSSIGSLNSKGDGDNDYTFTEMQTLTGTAYYRVKQIDIDGKSTYSSIISLRNNNQPRISIYPNPTKGLVTVMVGNNLLNKNVVLADMQGKVLQTIKISSLSFTINLAGYPVGFYVIKIDNESRLKIMKE
ncbi:MAG: C-terminal target protein, partial [Chitinophagaceae bacterium]|nr:C-terminal target protein [Chitinophagaceae bacterium]